MLPKAWATVAGQAEERAAHHEQGGFAQTAADLYVRAAVMWGRAQHSIFDAADPRKLAFREAEWVERALNGVLAEADRDVRHYVHRDGRTTDGTANPTWRLGAVPAQIADASRA
jgi:hypothetical protein